MNFSNLFNLENNEKSYQYRLKLPTNGRHGRWGRFGMEVGKNEQFSNGIVMVTCQTIKAIKNKYILLNELR